MFGFGKKEKSVPVQDMIYISKAKKFNVLQALIAKEENCKIVCWFETTRAELIAFLPDEKKHHVIIANQYFYSPGMSLYFAEHYPLKETEQELFKSLMLEKVVIYSALDEPLFTIFGGDKIIAMMKQMGMKEDEALEHSMISKAIQNAQEKIAKKVLVEQRTTSPEEWVIINLNQS